MSNKKQSERDFFGESCGQSFGIAGRYAIVYTDGNCIRIENWHKTESAQLLPTQARALANHLNELADLIDAAEEQQ